MSPELSGARDRYAHLGWPLALAGSVLMIATPFLPWSFNQRILGNLSVYGYPGTVQFFYLALGVAALAFTVTRRGPLQRFADLMDVPRALSVVGITALAFMVLVLLVIALDGGGLINTEPGGWGAVVAALLLRAGAYLMPATPVRGMLRLKLAAWFEILFLVSLVGSALFLFAFALGLSDPWALVLLLLTVAGVFVAMSRAGIFAWITILSVRHRPVILLAAIFAAFAFPLTQSGSDANMSIATQVIIFASAALGLNIVVGQAGLLDLGYIAFLGAGAYVAAMMSHSAFATIDWKPPFFVVMLIGATVSAIMGLIIGSPTLRVSGDYLAIVTLAFGEIFRLAVINLNGTAGPDLTHGANGIPAIPDLEFLGFNFGETHDFFGFTISRFANYYFLLLVVLAFIILVFVRLSHSRIGRGWIAIREDERAAEAMGVNTFGLKLLAFAGGAFLAGLAGTVKAHQDVSVTPDQYQFLESAFLLAAVVLGGMGTVAGVLLGATILKLLPEKLRELSEYRLLAFGILLVLMMRFRPEGLIASTRRRLEFHDDDPEMVERAEDIHLEKAANQ